MSLDGDWHYIVDQYGRGLYAGNGTVRDVGYARNRHPDLTFGSRVDEYDFATAPTMKVPGDWNSQDKTLFRYEGRRLVRARLFRGSSRRRPHAPSCILAAANYRSYVWVNAQRICDHEGGYTPYDCEVTAALHPGINAVTIAVDATRMADEIPAINVDWLNYGGLTRDVSLVTVPQAFIDDYDIHLKRGYPPLT